MSLTKTGFHPIINEWFLETYGSPTDVLKKAWPEIASGNHLLITAPTVCCMLCVVCVLWDAL